MLTINRVTSEFRNRLIIPDATSRNIREPGRDKRDQRLSSALEMGNANWEWEYWEWINEFGIT